MKNIVRICDVTVRIPVTLPALEADNGISRLLERGKILEASYGLPSMDKFINTCPFPEFTIIFCELWQSIKIPIISLLDWLYSV